MRVGGRRPGVSAAGHARADNQPLAAPPLDACPSPCGRPVWAALLVITFLTVGMMQFKLSQPLPEPLLGGSWDAGADGGGDGDSTAGAGDGE
jgi:hypothetical protein